MVGQGVMRECLLDPRAGAESMRTTEQMGKAMIAVAAQGAPKKILENANINAL
jgi:hypothetical protein